MACVSKVLIQISRAVAGEHAHGPAIVPAEVITGPGPGDRINCFSTKGSKHFAKINNIDALFRVAVKSKKLTQYQQAVYRRMIRMVLSDERSANHREKLTSLVLTKEQEIGRLQNQIAEDRAKTDLACQSARVQRNNVRRRHKALVTAKDDDICRLQTQIADDREKANRAHKDSRGRIARYKTQLAEKDDEIYQLQTQTADDREKANRAHKDSRVRIASYKTQLVELGQEIRRLEQQIANDGAKAIRALDTAEIQSNREKKAQKEFLDLCHDILMLGKDQEIARLKKRIAEGQKAAEQLAEANAAQHSEILRQQIEIQELKDALANADVLHGANSAQHTTTLHAREAEIERLFATQPQFMNELVDQNDKIASQANELARFVDIVRDQKATISTLESSLVIKEKEIARTEKSLNLEMKVTEELYARIVRLEDRPSLFRYNKWIILWLEMSLANRQKVIARYRDFLDKERSELGRLENERRVDLAQHAKELCDRDADIMRLCATQTQLIIELADQNVEIANLTSELAKAGCSCSGKANADAHLVCNHVQVAENAFISARDSSDDAVHTAVLDIQPESPTDRANDSTVSLDSGFLGAGVSNDLKLHSSDVHPDSEFSLLLSDKYRLSSNSLASEATLCSIVSAIKASSSACSVSESKTILDIPNFDTSQPAAEVPQDGDVTADISPVPPPKPPGRQKAITRLQVFRRALKWRP